jgi:hypothetical protein
VRVKREWEGVVQRSEDYSGHGEYEGGAGCHYQSWDQVCRSAHWQSNDRDSLQSRAILMNVCISVRFTGTFFLSDDPSRPSRRDLVLVDWAFSSFPAFELDPSSAFSLRGFSERVRFPSDPVLAETPLLSFTLACRAFSSLPLPSLEALLEVCSRCRTGGGVMT